MSLVHLLNRRYAPYYKWLLRSTGELPLSGAFFVEQISALVLSQVHEEKITTINAICAAVIELLRAEGLSDSSSRFLVDHGSIVHERIVDQTLRSMNVWIGWRSRGRLFVAELSMKRILVIGGSFFSGRVFLEELVKQSGVGNIAESLVFGRIAGANAACLFSTHN